jgi:hypothetical protein
MNIIDELPRLTLIELQSLPPMSLDKFAIDSGLCSATLWRYRKKGWLKTLNICGRQYVSRLAIAEFNMRAERGEFAKEHVSPRRPRRSV